MELKDKEQLKTEILQTWLRSDVARQEEAGTLPVERDKIELAMMVQAYTSERRFIESQGTSLGSAAVTLEDTALGNPTENPTQTAE